MKYKLRPHCEKYKRIIKYIPIKTHTLIGKH